jgi:hypothetical protein
MQSRHKALQQWKKEIREVATETREPGSNLKALNAFLSACAKNLAYLKFEESLRAKTKATKATKKAKKAA